MLLFVTQALGNIKMEPALNSKAICENRIPGLNEVLTVTSQMKNKWKDLLKQKLKKPGSTVLDIFWDSDYQGNDEVSSRCLLETVYL